MFEYRTRGVCSRMIRIDAEDGVIRSVEFIGGCAGNTQGIMSLVRGMKVDEVIERLQGIVCRAGTSCPDQLARALVEMKQAQQ